MTKLKFKLLNNPILIVSDNPCLTSGLARMGRDLASLLCTMPEFRVGYLGRGLGQKRKMPFMLYDYPEHMGWGEAVIQHAWDDLSNGDPGVIFTLDDISRRGWFARPPLHPLELREFLGENRNFYKWGYFPVDSLGPVGPLSQANGLTVSMYDRVLAPTEWGKNVLGCDDYIPHGLWPDKFRIIPGARDLVQGTSLYKILVGCVMANQSRKDFPVAIQCFDILKQKYKSNIRFWIHTDEPLRYWDIYSLLKEHDVTADTIVTSNLNDDQMALWYSACACTILPSAGEGFGFPIIESLACGTPCIVTDYAGGSELVPNTCRVLPTSYRVDTQHSCQRAVLHSGDFAQAASEQIEAKEKEWDKRAADLATTVEHLHWPKLQYVWKGWLQEGLK